MFDFILRRGNPTNRWQRASDLALTVVLDAPAINGVALGDSFRLLSFLGRNDDVQCGALCYHELGVGVDRAKDGTLDAISVVFEDSSDRSRPFAGTLLWKDGRLEPSQLTQDNLRNLFGDWYWLDEDEDERIAFYEYPDYEMQIELSLIGSVKRVILTRAPLLSDPWQREAYGVEKQWPPVY